FLSMMFKMTELKYRPDPVLEHALDVLFILHADHEQNCSSTTMRAIGSAHSDPYAAVAGAAAALGGPRHGSANEEVVHMLHEIGSVDRVPDLIKRVKAGELRLMGFGHRVYKNYDPRARLIKKIAYDVFEVTGKNPLIEIALELERIALQDDYFVSRRLYPNVDFYSGIIYEAMGLPVAMFPVMFAIARTAGWMAQWAEMVLDEEQKIVRPKQIYIGYDERHYVPLDQRREGGAPDTEYAVTARFEGLAPPDALRRLLGDLNFALLPQTNGPAKLFVYRKSLDHATQLVQVGKGSAKRSRPSKIIGKELILTLKRGSKTDVAALSTRLHGRVVGRLDAFNAFRLEFDDDTAAREARAALEREGDVASIENNSTIAAPGVLEPLEMSSPGGLPIAPNVSPSTDQVVVGLIDTAVQMQGTMFKDFLQPG